MISNAKVTEHKNRLKFESSPYLLQHAGNPVDWYPWGDEAFLKARNENKLLIISIGYSACHWCHVMERETFEDESVADIMNRLFVSVKVDREERPDVDKIYMDGVQLITGRGGWPLNVFALPDGRPIYGGTYFSRDQWISLLQQMADFAEKYPDKSEEQAEALTRAINSFEKINVKESAKEYSPSDAEEIFNNWKNSLDFDHGGHKGSPKFPMPSGFIYLLYYAHVSESQEAEEAVALTLKKMAYGGIYDQIGGGFARYSTDKYWKVPHFEKMLYDNAQLVSLYSLAWKKDRVSVYKEVVYSTLDFIERELTSPEGFFFSSVDADSDGEEGNYYVWTREEIERIAGVDAALVTDYYQLTKKGNWENGKNVLMRSDYEDLTLKFGISEEEIRKRINFISQKLLEERNKRERPSTDSKMITAWNALMIRAFTDAFRTFRDKKFLMAAVKALDFIVNNVMSKDFRLSRIYKDGKVSGIAFLDDYAFMMDALLNLYEATFNESYLNLARNFLNYTLDHFYDAESGMFYYSDASDNKLIARKMEIADHVVPSSNSVMAKNLLSLGVYYYNHVYTSMATEMVNNIKENAITGGPYYAVWDMVLSRIINPPVEVVIIGDNYSSVKDQIDNYYFPDVLLSGGKVEGMLPLHESRLITGQTTIYVCRNRMCNLPVTSVDEALKQIRSES